MNFTLQYLEIGLTLHSESELYSRRTFVSGTSSLLLTTLAKASWIEPSGAAPRQFVYVGSISAAKSVLPDSTTGEGKGIYIFEADLATGALTYKDVMANKANPWWIATNPAGTYLYSANEISTQEGDTSGSICAYAIDRKTGGLTLLNTISSGGSRPAQLSVHPSGKYVLVANFGGNSLNVFPIQTDGSLGAPSDVQHDSGIIGPDKPSSAPPGGLQRNGHDRPRPHMIRSDVAGRYVVSADLSMDGLLVWKFNLGSGVLTPSGNPIAHVGAGDGARHFAFHPDGKLLFSLQEEGGTIVSFNYDPDSGLLTQKQTLSTLPDGYKGTFYTSEIMVAPSGNYVYTLNRLYDSIVCFRIAKDGMLTKVAEEWARGSFPRHLAFSPNGKFMYICNQRNDEIATFAVNLVTGGLHFTGQFTAAATPAILVFLP